MKRFLRNNGLSLTLFGLFLVSFLGQALSGMHKYNGDQQEHGNPTVSLTDYVKSDDFMEGYAENWESEFLQLFTFVLLTRFVYQKGSPESRDPDSPEQEDTDTPPERQPWPVRKGGVVLKLYEHSLSLTFLLLFFLSMAFHAIGGAGEYNQEQLDHGGEQVTVWGYMLSSTFWYESLQNWQSEFLSLFAMVFLSIWLREKESPESKPVKAAHKETGH
jgi:uncharacterized protein DUF6766